MTYLTLRERIHGICEENHEICEENHGFCEENHHLKKVQKFTARSVANGLRLRFVRQIGLLFQLNVRETMSLRPEKVGHT